MPLNDLERQVITDLINENFQLRSAVINLYDAAHWSPDRPCDADALWIAVRDAAGLEPGQSLKLLGEPRK